MAVLTIDQELLIEAVVVLLFPCIALNKFFNVFNPTALMASLALFQMDALSPCMDFHPSVNSPNYRKQGHTVCLTEDHLLIFPLCLYWHASLR